MRGVKVLDEQTEARIMRWSDMAYALRVKNIARALGVSEKLVRGVIERHRRARMRAAGLIVRRER